MSIVLDYNPVPSGNTIISFYYASNTNTGQVTFTNFGAYSPPPVILPNTSGVNSVFTYDLSSVTSWPGGSLNVTIDPQTGNITQFGSTNGIIPNSNQWLSSVTISISTLNSLAYAFASTSSTNFNVININNSFTSGISNFNGTFKNCPFFNFSISGWNTSSATNMISMFENAFSFNQNIGSWDISGVTNMTNMLDNTALSSGSPNNFDNILNGWAAQAPSIQSNVVLGAQGLTYTSASLSSATTLVNTYSWTLSGASGPAIPCFGENTKILCLKNNKEEYQTITSLRKGDLVKTAKDGYLKIDMIGTSKIYNFGEERIPDRLYLLTKEKYPELIDELILTGYHSILVDNLTEKQREDTLKLMKNTYVTGDKYRLAACLDEKAEPYNKDGFFDVYHFSLENNNYFSNYGVYANGLLVETCSKRYMKELSGMTEIV